MNESTELKKMQINWKRNAKKGLQNLTHYKRAKESNRNTERNQRKNLSIEKSQKS